MFEFFKKISLKSETVVHDPDQDETDRFIETLSDLLSNETLIQTISSPENKLAILTVYHENIHSLLYAITTKTHISQKTATTAWIFFNKGESDIKLHLKTMIKLIESNKLSLTVKSDINELLTFFSEITGEQYA